MGEQDNDELRLGGGCVGARACSADHRRPRFHSYSAVFCCRFSSYFLQEKIRGHELIPLRGTKRNASKQLSPGPALAGSHILARDLGGWLRCGGNNYGGNDYDVNISHKGAAGDRQPPHSMLLHLLRRAPDRPSGVADSSRA